MFLHHTHIDIFDLTLVFTYQLDQDFPLLLQFTPLLHAFRLTIVASHQSIEKFLWIQRPLLI